MIRNYILKNKSKIAIISSILLHSLFLLSFQSDESLGTTKKPIKLTEIIIISGPGESINKNILSKLKKKPTKKEVTQKKQSEKLTDLVKANSEIPINSDTKKDINKNANKNEIDKQEVIQSSKSQETSIIGNKSKHIKNEIQRGSLKGKGRKVIICKQCLEPIYSQKSIRKGLEGITIIKVTIDKNGLVVNAKIVASSGHKDIDNASISAAMKSTFQPISEISFITIKYEHKIN